MKYMLDVEDTELWKQIKKDAALKEMSISSLIQDLLQQYIDLGEVLNRWEEEDKKILKNLKQASKLSVSRGNAVRGLIFALPVGLFLWFLIIWSILTMIGWIKTCL